MGTTLRANCGIRTNTDFWAIVLQNDKQISKDQFEVDMYLKMPQPNLLPPGAPFNNMV